jgi:hypothetical protein
MLLKVMGLDDASLLKWGKLNTILLTTVGAVLMLISLVAILRFMPMAKELQTITIDLTHDMQADESIDPQPMYKQAHGLLTSYAELPTMFIGYLAGLGLFLGFTIVYSGVLHWKIRSVLKQIPQQAGPGYPPQGVGSPDP